jgi:hypothetical protein
MLGKARYLLLLFLFLASCGYVEETNFIVNTSSEGLIETSITAWLTDGTQTTAPASPININQTTAYAIQWNNSFLDTDYFEHSTTVNSHELKVKAAGNYFIAVTVPMTSALQRSCVQVEVRVNGSPADGGIGESSYIRNYDNHTESSSHIAMVLNGLSADDVIGVYVKGTALAGTVTISSVASLYVEYIRSNKTVFSGTATQTTFDTNLNQTTAYALEWTEGLKSTGFTHSDAVNPENITVDSDGDYLIFVNVPITSTVTRGNIKILIQDDDVTVPGGEGKQGYIRNSDGHNDASVHWSGLARNVSAGSIITVKTIRESEAGIITVQASKKASIFILKIDTSSDVFFSRATRLFGPTDNWNPNSAISILWENDDVIDSTIFNHSTAVNAHQITVNQTGDYLLVYNDSFTSTLQRPNPKITVQVNGSEVSGAETKCHYIRNSSAHSESSGTLVFLLKDLTSGDVITFDATAEALTGTVNDDQESLLLIWRKP